jgi:hypothetical protein
MLRVTGTPGTSTNFTVQIVLEQLRVFQVVKKIHAFMKLEGSPLFTEGPHWILTIDSSFNIFTSHTPELHFNIICSQFSVCVHTNIFGGFRTKKATYAGNRAAVAFGASFQNYFKWVETESTWYVGH